MQKIEGWDSTEDRPLEPGEKRIMAMQILRNGEPDWDVFIGTPADDDEWADESHDPGWAPSEVQYSAPVPSLPAWTKRAPRPRPR